MGDRIHPRSAGMFMGIDFRGELKGASHDLWPVPFFRPWLRVAWPIGMSRGIRSVLCAPAVKPSWRVNTSPPETTALTASSALAACMPRSARPAANPSQARLRHLCSSEISDNIELWVCTKYYDKERKDWQLTVGFYIGLLKILLKIFRIPLFAKRRLLFST